MKGRRARASVLGIALAAIALAATFGIGILVGREIARPPAAASADVPPVYDLSPYAGVAPELLSYRLLVEVPVILENPRGIASAADGTIYICGDRSLLALDRGGSVKRRWDLDGEPSCVAAGTDGTLYIGMSDHVEVLRPGAAAASAWPDLGRQAIVTSVAIVGSGVFVADAGNRMVLRFDAGGRLAGTIGGDYTVPSPYFDVAGSPDGTVWVADPGHHRVRHFTVDGKPLGSWGTSSLEIDGFGGCCNPVHLAVCLCGSIITAEKGIPRVKVYGADGTLTGVVAVPSDFASAETGLDLATRKANGGEVLVLVTSKRVVRVYVKKDAVVGG
jgi:sugar lactone lactonase YvrE